MSLEKYGPDWDSIGPSNDNNDPPFPMMMIRNI